MTFDRSRSSFEMAGDQSQRGSAPPTDKQRSEVGQERIEDQLGPGKQDSIAKHEEELCQH